MSNTIVPHDFIQFVRQAPVSSGVCCCGGTDCTDHAFVDQWDWSLSTYVDEILSPTHIHTKSQNGYRLLGVGKMQTHEWGVDMQEVAIYQGADGQLWVRPIKDFKERFEEL